MTDVVTAPARVDSPGWISRLASHGVAFPCSFRVHPPTGEVIAFGDNAPELDIYIRNDHGMRALQSASELAIADAYVRGDIEIEGDVVKAMWLRNFLSDRNLWLKLWRRLQPLHLRPGEAQSRMDRQALRLEQRAVDGSRPGLLRLHARHLPHGR